MNECRCLQVIVSSPSNIPRTNIKNLVGIGGRNTMIFLSQFFCQRGWGGGGGGIPSSFCCQKGSKTITGTWWELELKILSGSLKMEQKCKKFERGWIHPPFGPPVRKALVPGKGTSVVESRQVESTEIRDSTSPKKKNSTSLAFYFIWTRHRLISTRHRLTIYINYQFEITIVYTQIKLGSNTSNVLFSLIYIH
jgi:hypothetical protein